MGFFTSSLLLPTHGKKSVGETGLVTTQPSYLFTVWESGVSVCGILFFGVDTWPAKQTGDTRYVRRKNIHSPLENKR